MLASASKAIICWFSRCFLVLQKPELFSYGNKKNPKYYVMHPSSARHYSDLCHLQTFCPFLTFPSILEPGCQLTGEEPISQSRFLPFPPTGCPPVGGRGCRPPCQGVHHRSNPEARAGTQACPLRIPPSQDCCISHATATRKDGMAGPGCTGGTLSPTPASQDALSLCNGYPRAQPPHAACSHWLRLSFLTPKK